MIYLSLFVMSTLVFVLVRHCYSHLFLFYFILFYFIFRKFYLTNIMEHFGWCKTLFETLPIIISLNLPIPRLPIIIRSNFSLSLYPIILKAGSPSKRTVLIFTPLLLAISLHLSTIFQRFAFIICTEFFHNFW